MHEFFACPWHKCVGGGQPAGGTFCAADKQKNHASKVNKLTFGYMAYLQEMAQGVKG